MEGLQDPATCVTEPQHNCLFSKWKVYKVQQHVSLNLNITVFPASGKFTRSSNLCHWTSTYQSVQQAESLSTWTSNMSLNLNITLSNKWKVCLQGPATCVTVLQHICLSSKWKVYKDQHASLHLSISVCPTLKRSSQRTSNQCVSLYLNRRLCPSRGSSPRTTNLYHWASTKVSVQQDAVVYQEPAGGITELLRTVLFSKRR